MVNFENAQVVSEWITVRIGVQPRAEHHNLTDTALKGCGQSIFREACPDGDEESHSGSGWVLPSPASDALRVHPQDGQSKRIGEDPTLLQYLMSGSVKSCGQGGPAWLSVLHAFRVYQSVSGQALLPVPTPVGLCRQAQAGVPVLLVQASSRRGPVLQRPWALSAGRKLQISDARLRIPALRDTEARGTFGHVWAYDDARR